jgi:hypothetical protein
MLSGGSLQAQQSESIAIVGIQAPRWKSSNGLARGPQSIDRKPLKTWGGGAEVIVSDDGQTTATRELISACFPNVKWYQGLPAVRQAVVKSSPLSMTIISLMGGGSKKLLDDFRFRRDGREKRVWARRVVGDLD